MSNTESAPDLALASRICGSADPCFSYRQSSRPSGNRNPDDIYETIAGSVRGKDNTGP